jgi:hypothetical protein
MLMKPKQDGGTVYMSNDERYLEGPTKDGADQEIDSYTIAAEELMAALESRNVQAVKDSLKSFVDMCASEDYEE